MTDSDDAAYNYGFLTDVVSADRVSLDPSGREQVATVPSPHEASLPDAVVQAETTAAHVIEWDIAREQVTPVERAASLYPHLELIRG